MVAFQIESSIGIDNELFAIMESGEFGRIENDEDDKSSFVALSETNFEPDDIRRHFLYEYHFWIGDCIN